MSALQSNAIGWWSQNLSNRNLHFCMESTSTTWSDTSFHILTVRAVNENFRTPLWQLLLSSVYLFPPEKVLLLIAKLESGHSLSSDTIARPQWPIKRDEALCIWTQVQCLSTLTLFAHWCIVLVAAHFMLLPLRPWDRRTYRFWMLHCCWLQIRDRYRWVNRTELYQIWTEHRTFIAFSVSYFRSQLSCSIWKRGQLRSVFGRKLLPFKKPL